MCSRPGCCLHRQGRARSQGHDMLNSEIRRLLRSPGTVGDEDQANKFFDQLWQKILEEMEHTLDRDLFDKQLFDDIYEFFAAKEEDTQRQHVGTGKADEAEARRFWVEIL